MSYADTAAVAVIRSCEHGDAVNCAFLCRLNLKTEGGTFLCADAAAVAYIGIDNGLLPLLLGNKLACLAFAVKNDLVFADLAACAAVNAAVGVNLMLLLHITADCHYGTNLCAVIAAFASIGNFICHILLHSAANF